MKEIKRSIAALILGAAVTLSGCASLIPPKTTMPVFTAPEAGPTIPASTESQGTEAPEPTKDAGQRIKMLEAYQDAMHGVEQRNVFPGGQEIALYEDGRIDAQNFALADITGDGEEELLISIGDTFMAGMVLKAYRYDGTGLQEILRCTPLATIYEGGIVKASALHSQGWAGDLLWPYDCYELQDGVFQEVCAIDAWDKALYDMATEGTGKDYPQSYDKDNAGCVYIMRTDDGENYLSKSEYLAWEAEHFAGKKEISISWQAITPANIQSAFGL